ncbi:hypothetical protein ASG84_26310 [Rhodococcus sp. Leaf278]|uniref:hypothetical protein n=1 Tax=Rhodococcus sp. Leaf278 TaxID=1736319 RepID=UPI000710D6EB|nr:hypothetical protein [Rhodococcus sp. Leaf278]KQU49267.1 hypothetical protein ASG84_26310 [Rhodococcus sp. Leaf278]
MSTPIEPNAVVQLIEQYIDDEHRAAERADNKTALDEDGIYGLHNVAAKVYALGFYDGTCVANERHNRRRGRERENARAEAES